MVREMLNLAGISQPIHSYPILRGLFIAQSERNVLIYPIAKQKQIENQYHWIGKISRLNNYLFKYRGRDDIQISSIQDAKPYSIGVTRGSNIIYDLLSLNIDNLKEVTDGEQNILKLKYNRIDLLASDELVLNHLIDNYNRTNKNKLDFREFEKVILLPGSQNELYVAVGKHADPEFVSTIRDAFHTVQTSGVLIEVAHFWTNDHE
jgi:polar amino acid transport system substrate-binding protein